MDLKFLGRGAAFNPIEGNNSAFFIENDELFLIDCGESVFESIITNNLLNSDSSINLFITHTHSDHIGSIGSLIMYSFYVLHKKLKIIIPSEPKYLSNIKMILDGFGCTDLMYNFVIESDLDDKYNSFSNVRFIETKHCNEFACYSILFNTPEGMVFFSGDTKEFDIVKSLIDSGNKIDKLYIDTTSADYPENVHLYIGILEKNIPENLKKCVYCMHLNNIECIDKALDIGFNVVHNEFRKKIL